MYCIRQASYSNNPQILVAENIKDLFLPVAGTGWRGQACFISPYSGTVSVFAGGHSKGKAEHKELRSGSQSFCPEVTQGTAISSSNLHGSEVMYCILYGAYFITEVPEAEI